VGYRRERRSNLRAHTDDADHVGSRSRSHLEPAMGLFQGAGWRKWTESFALLTIALIRSAHLRVSGIRKDAPISRARGPYSHSPPIPGENSASAISRAAEAHTASKEPMRSTGYVLEAMKSSLDAIRVVTWPKSGAGIRRLGICWESDVRYSAAPKPSRRLPPQAVRRPRQETGSNQLPLAGNSTPPRPPGQSAAAQSCSAKCP